MDFLYQVETRLDMSAGEKAEVMRELSAHYDGLYSEFVASGMGAAQAQAEAEAHMGAAADIAARLSAAHNTTSRKSAFLCAVPFLGWAICVLMPTRTPFLICGSLLGAVLIVGSAGELLGGRRPLWLATWLAMSCLGAWHLITYFHLQNGPAALTFLALSLVFVMAGVWKSLEWRRRGVGYVLLGVVGAAVNKVTCPHTPHPSVFLQMAYGASMFGILIALIALVYTFAMRLFADHRYGSPWQASLFLFAFCVCLDMWTNLSLSAWFTAFSFSAAGLAMIAFVLATQWRHKVAALGAGILAKFALFDAIVHLGHTRTNIVYFGLESYITDLLFSFCLAACFSLAPMLSERADREGGRNRLTIAR